MSKLTCEEVLKLAQLASLALSDEAVEEFRVELRDIIQDIKSKM